MSRCLPLRKTLSSKVIHTYLALTAIIVLIIPMARILCHSRWYQRLILRCIFAAAFITAILCFGIVWPPTVNADSSHDDHQPERGSQKSQGELIEKIAVEQTSIAQHSTIPQHHGNSVTLARLQPEEQTATTSDRQWLETFHRIENLLDDEYRLTALLAPITGTGEPLLRDLTYRVRAFKDVFKTWEDLQLVPKDSKSGAMTYVLDKS
jgi:hypothetical protein